MSKLPLSEVEDTLRKLTLDEAPTYFAGVPVERQDVYRRLVRGSIASVIKTAIPVARQLVDDDTIDAVIARYLAESPPTTRLYRDIPLGFAAWALGKSQSGDDAAFPHPAFAELVHWEVAELDVLYAPDAPDFTSAPHPTDDVRVAFDPSCRLLAYAHPVHELTLSKVKAGTTWPARAKSVCFVLAHRQAERLKWMKLTPTLTQLLAQAAEDKTVGEILDALDAAFGAPVDRAYCRSWLMNLKDRGALLGFVVPA